MIKILYFFIIFFIDFSGIFNTLLKKTTLNASKENKFEVKILSSTEVYLKESYYYKNSMIFLEDYSKIEIAPNVLLSNCIDKYRSSSNMFHDEVVESTCIITRKSKEVFLSKDNQFYIDRKTKAFTQEDYELNFNGYFLDIIELNKDFFISKINGNSRISFELLVKDNEGKKHKFLCRFNNDFFPTNKGSCSDTLKCEGSYNVDLVKYNSDSVFVPNNYYGVRLNMRDFILPTISCK